MVEMFSSRLEYMIDLSNGYDNEAESFLASRSLTIGVATIHSWIKSLPAGARVLELGCGNGIPITQTLLGEGLNVYAVDASPKMVAAFRENFPDTSLTCQAAEQLSFIDQKFDAVLAWGLMFLLTPENQQLVIQNAGKALNSGGRFLFTAPKETVTWADLKTGHKSRSLGDAEYRSLLSSAGMILIAQYNDEGSNHYYEAKKE